ncbi:b-glycosyltransferase, glycosyltransferase family 2 protein [Sporocytophaga myxococcoides]|uniref:B-glycosyltransferase, glycosyltransferase family 2 protein n=1 Tax=Sporocytophaga myxococcoides TaxID=153721 RepID=A0A098LL18_9BACT|nr:glycosyltransferase family 2 protein [Sporocytophaga myxococcoides]GAL87219.1 b-glycosyltransferase, glycosyltransferase family 2 protein [Sporocytophaga myxococcoides]
MPEISVIIPIYNEEKNILLLYKRVSDVLQNLNVEYELVFVNDGSKDKSINIICSLAKSDLSVKYIDFSRNFGHQIAVTAGLDKCTGNFIVIIDADLQDPPELIIDLYAKAKQGFEVVYAKRKTRKGENVLKKLTAYVFYRLLAKITSCEIPVDTGDFRIMSRKVLDVLKNMPEQQKYLRGQIAWIGFNQTFVEYDRNERHSGKTGYTYRKMLKFAFDGITSFSNFPLKVASIAGFIVSGIAFIIMLYTLYSRFVSKDFVPGWTSLMLSVMFIGGIQLICMGIIGEYISRIANNVRNRPLYIINETNLNTIEVESPKVLE